MIKKNIIHMIDIGLYGHMRFHSAYCTDRFLVNGEAKAEKMTDLLLKMY